VTDFISQTLGILVAVAIAPVILAVAGALKSPLRRRQLPTITQD